MPNSNIDFTIKLSPPLRYIYRAELEAVISAISTGKDAKAKSIVIFTDSQKVVNLFNSHRVSNLVHILFQEAINVMLHDKLDVKVKHISGERTDIADSLSRNNLNLTRAKLPNIHYNDLQALSILVEGGMKKSLQSRMQTQS